MSRIILINLRKMSANMYALLLIAVLSLVVFDTGVNIPARLLPAGKLTGKRTIFYRDQNMIPPFFCQVMIFI